MTTTFAEQMLAKYEALLLKYAGFKSVSIDGETVSIAELEEKHAYWAAAVEHATKPAAKTISLRRGV